LFGVFGGGGSAPVLPPGYYRRPHYVLSQFIGCKPVSPNMEDSKEFESPRVTLPAPTPPAPIDAEISDANGNFPTKSSAKPVNHGCRQSVVVGCAFHMADATAGLGVALKGCLEASELGLPGVLGCQAAAGALLGPGTAYVDYKLLQNCKAEYAACGR
jgi:hypothetical protein